MKENFTEINNGLEQFSDETSRDVDKFTKSIYPFYKELINKGYSHLQIQNMLFCAYLKLKIDIEFNNEDKYIIKQER
ncbi:hypothetical protein [Clostridium perfringens]|uniref:hypothetical protein n=1 Tax=Clostridium perfringens TaxID=1502 RepID=UPI00096AC0F5|nr:hypothetical protein [Clostridium perfringens]